jgi:hypothetical protein
MKTWHYLLAGYIGSFVWSILAGVGGLLWGTSGLPVGRQIVLTLISAPITSIMGLLFGILFKVVEPRLIMIPRKLSAAIFWAAIAGAIAAMSKQLNFHDFRFYIGFGMAAIAGLCFEMVLSALQMKKDSQQIAGP